MDKRKYDIDAQIKEIHAFSERFYRFSVEAPEIAKNTRPGQFVNVKVQEDNITDPLLRTPLAVHSVDEKGLGLYFKKVGKATSLLAQKRPGETIKVMGPLGNGYELDEDAKKEKKALLVGGGHGAAPLYFLAQELLRQKRDVYCFLGGDSEDSVKVSRNFEDLGVQTRTATEDGTCGARGFVSCLLESFLQNRKEPCEVFACGPGSMIKTLLCLGVEAENCQVSVDSYVACGIGACQGCAVRTKNGYKLACKDGPVFKASELIL